MPRMYDRDPYAVLGISPGATARQIKEAYHRLARKYHPDLNKEPYASERMQEINWAYSILGDRQQRSFHDLWRSSSDRAKYYSPGTRPPDPGAAYRTTPSSAGSQTRNPPPYNPYRGSTYTDMRASQTSSVVGCSSWGIAWIIITLITNLVRGIGSPLSQRPNYNYSLEFRATQTAQMERIASTINTINASHSFSTAPDVVTTSLPFWYLVTPSPAAKMREDEVSVQEGWRSRIVPGSWEWHYISSYFPELTTPNGLSAEVTDIIYNQLRGYHIMTKSSGDYWLYISPYDNRLTPAHFPPASTATPTR